MTRLLLLVILVTSLAIAGLMLWPGSPAAPLGRPATSASAKTLPGAPPPAASASAPAVSSNLVVGSIAGLTALVSLLALIGNTLIDWRRASLDRRHQQLEIERLRLEVDQFRYQRDRSRQRDKPARRD
jgi:hypothetical protein